MRIYLLIVSLLISKMNLPDIIAELRELNEPVPKPLRLPTADEIKTAEDQLDVRFPDDYRRYLLEASDVVYGALEPAVVIPEAGHLSLVEMAETAWDEMEVPRELLPFCEDNGDYYCLNPTGEVEYWSHNGTTDEKWKDLATWIKEVWIDES
jgi:SMI1-KNR4 cell-wall